MGQYFIVVNTTKKEYLHPHKFGSGLKFREFTLDPMSVLTGMAHLLAQSSDVEYWTGVASSNSKITGRWIGDHVLIVGDYDTSKLFDIAYDCYTDISEAVITHMCYDPVIHEHLKQVTRWDGTGHTPVTDVHVTELPTLSDMKKHEEVEQDVYSLESLKNLLKKQTTTEVN